MPQDKSRCDLPTRNQHIEEKYKYYLDVIKGRWIILQGRFKIISVYRTHPCKMSATPDSSLQFYLNSLFYKFSHQTGQLIG